VTRTVGDGEAAFGGAVNQMRGGAEVGREIGVASDRLENLRCGEISVFTNQRVNGSVFSELLHAGGEDDELAAIGHGHAGAVDGLVADPRTLEFGGIEVNDGLPDGLVEHHEIDVQAELSGLIEALDVVADEESASGFRVHHGER